MYSTTLAGYPASPINTQSIINQGPGAEASRENTASPEASRHDVASPDAASPSDASPDELRDGIACPDAACPDTSRDGVAWPDATGSASVDTIAAQSGRDAKRDADRSDATDSDGMNSARIAWLEKAYKLLRAELLPEAPERVTITFGFPSKGARPSRNQRIGEYAHFLKDCDAGPGLLTLHPTVFREPARVLDVLLHEMIHAARPNDGHRGQFPKLAKRVGLTGKMTATSAGPELKAKLETWLRDRLPAMPNGHGDLSADRKKQSTRLRKYFCPDCGQIVRAATDCLNAVCADCDAHFIMASGGAR